MAILIDRINGQNYADNVVDPILFFSTGTWTTVSGTGTSLLNVANAYTGVSSLRLENNVPASSYTASNSVQSTEASYDGVLKVSWFAKKTISTEVVNASVLIYKNAVLLQTDSFSIGSTDAAIDKNNVWQRFQTDLNIDVSKSDDITFQFRIDPSTTAQATTSIYFDGFMVNEGGRDNTIVPAYTKPLNLIAGTQLFGSYMALDQINEYPVTTTVIDTWYNVVNNGGGALTTEVAGYSGITPYNIVNNNFDLLNLSLYDDVELRFDLKVTTASVNQSVLFRLNIASGTAFLNIFNKDYDVSVTDRQETVYMSVNVLTELSRADGFKLECMSDKVDAVVSVNGYYIKVNKRLV